MGEVTHQRSVSILGATGSVGESTCDLLRRGNGAYRVEALTAHTNVDALAGLAIEMNAGFAAIGEPSLYGALREALSGTGISCKDASIEVWTLVCGSTRKMHCGCTFSST